MRLSLNVQPLVVHPPAEEIVRNGRRWRTVESDPPRTRFHFDRRIGNATGRAHELYVLLKKTADEIGGRTPTVDIVLVRGQDIPVANPEQLLSVQIADVNPDYNITVDKTTLIAAREKLSPRPV